MLDENGSDRLGFVRREVVEDVRLQPSSDPVGAIDVGGASMITP